MDERDPVAVELSFPRTLTLSLGEREQPARPMFSAHSFVIRISVKASSFVSPACRSQRFW